MQIIISFVTIILNFLLLLNFLRKYLLGVHQLFLTKQWKELKKSMRVRDFSSLLYFKKLPEKINRLKNSFMGLLENI